MGVADHGTAGQTTAAPSLASWAASVAAALDNSDTTVDARIAAHEADTTGIHGIADTAALVTNARTVTAGAGLTGGGSLAADRTFDVGAGAGIQVNADSIQVLYGSTAGTAAQGNDARLSDARTPVAHAASHAAAGSDPVTLAQSQVTNLTTDLASRALLATVGNLLTAAQATPDTGALTLSGCTEASGLVLTASGSGAYTASVPGVAVVVGQVYTVSAVLAPSGRAVATRISWRNSGGSEISAVAGDSVAAGASATTSMATGVAPAGAVTMIAYAAYAGTGSAGDAVTVTKFGVWAGAGGSWAAPGTPIANLGRRVTHPNTDDVLVRVWDGDAGRWQTAHYDSGWRDVSSLLNSTDWALSDSIGYCRARATYGEVEVIGRLKRVTAGANRNVRTVMLTLPTGFGGPKGYVPTGVFWVSDPLPVGMISDLGTENRLDANIPGASSGTWATGDQCAFRAKFARVSTIPTTLPGTLVSSAPA